MMAIQDIWHSFNGYGKQQSGKELEQTCHVILNKRIQKRFCGYKRDYNVKVGSPDY